MPLTRRILIVSHTDRANRVRIISPSEAPEMSGGFMKMESNHGLEDDLRPEYDVSKQMNEAELCIGKALKPGHGKIIIYDIGANNGDDIPYYLKKADVVVAVEANPDLCQQIQDRFSLEIQQKRLILENCVLTSEHQSEEVAFYIHKEKHVRSQFSPPKNISDFKQVFLPSKSVRQLFAEHGFPHYIKIDVEGYDPVILRSLFTEGIKPDYLSAESHSIEVFLLLTSFGEYNSFKIVEGRTVAKKYRNHPIKTMDGEEVYSFPRHSAGPFGEDVTGSWVDSVRLFRRLQSEGLGWKDIHARKEEAESQQLKPKIPWQLQYWSYKIQWLSLGAYRKIRNTLSSIFHSFF